MKYRGLELYPFQAEAVQAVQDGQSVIVSAPTGAGKTIIAEYAIEQSLERGRRVLYTSPIKALSNQKYRDFKERYGDKVGIMTGDVTVNGEAAILVMTTEIFRNTIFEDSSRLHGIDWLIFDEVHYLGDPDRGSVWEESIIFAPENVRFVALSATIGNLEQLRAWMAEVRGVPVRLVHTDERPVPLHRWLYLPEQGLFEARELKQRMAKAKESLPAPEQKRRRGNRDRDAGRGRRNERAGAKPRQGSDVLKTLVKDNRYPVLYFAFSRKKCESLARRYQRKLKLLSKEERREVVGLFDELVERYGATEHPACANLRESVQSGILYHHAGVLPIFKDVIERLFSTGLVKLLFATETFALGVNMPARCVVFDSLSKYNGVEMVPLSPLDYQQMAGRAGRQGIDQEGDVVGILDPRDEVKLIQETIYKKAGAIRSQFSLGYSTTLNLVKLLGEKVPDAVRRSFMAFQSGSAKKPLADLSQKMAALEERGYLQDFELTGKGSFCARINGFEIQLTELFWDGCFEDLDATQTAMLCAAIIHESRPRDSSVLLEMNLVPDAIARRARKRIREFRKSEAKAGYDPVVRNLDYALSAPLQAWINGEDFASLRRLTTMQDGDIVRAFRLTVQVLRQLAWALPPDNWVAENCRTAISLINRDEIDAEHQLEVEVGLD
ncbi:MAG: DEAD/DEAH box helicase [Planctomycetes bacterium]|nr:DEAD/DEAH box helicase [Planctomycetota bacterium]